MSLRIRSWLTAAAALGVVLASSLARPVVAEDKECGEFGTSVVFAKSPALAAAQALKEQKLVFILHVSGHFEESAYT